MKVGITGYSGAGKTTVFNALSGRGADKGAFKQKGAMNLGTVKVPDLRVDRLSGLFKPKKTIYAEVVFADLLAPAPDVSGNSFDADTLGHMRDMDALTHVIRGFDHPLTGDNARPLDDFRNLEMELELADLSVLEKRIERLNKEGGKSRELPLLEKLSAHLESEKPLRTLGLDEAEERSLRGYAFLSLKPLLVVLNLPEDAEEKFDELNKAVSEAGAGLFIMKGKMEEEIAELDEEDRKPFLEELGVAEPARDRFIRAAYAALDLVSFFTVGKDEVRSWPIKKGTVAVKAAGTIHTDLERGFIRAEVTRWEDLLELGSEANCRTAGKMRLEGKEYLVQDGDVFHVRFNV
ncbi:MAG: redox-regulated ATPase YchF [Deltaproteobacteria bacterium]|nr:redox-regulated ATPase YchF [Deltaproteobacteria bacterium]